MLRDAAVDIIMKRLGNQTDTTLRDDIIAEMAQAQATTLEGGRFHPWFLVSDETALVTVSGDEAVALPADFLTLWDYGGLSRYDSALDDPYIEMIRDDWDEIKAYFNYSDAPTHWDIAGANLLMRPLADAAYPLRFWYITRGESLAGTYGDAANIENVWLEHASDWLIAETGKVIAEQYLQYRPDAVRTWETQALRAQARLQVLNIKMEESLKKRVMGRYN